MFLSAIVNLWNAVIWEPWHLQNIYNDVDAIVIVESCWCHESEWSGDTSPDGTAALIDRFIAEFDIDKKITFIKAGIVKDMQAARNIAVNNLPHETTHLLIADADEFWLPGALQKVRDVIAAHPVGQVDVKQNVFYFDFSWVRREYFTRIYKYFPRQRCWVISQFLNPDDTVYTFEEVMAFHYAYVHPDWTRVKAAMGRGTEVSRDRYRKWWDIISQFDGTNLDVIEKLNGGTVHLFANGSVQPYDGPHPPILDSHPFRHWKWDNQTREKLKIGAINNYSGLE